MRKSRSLMPIAAASLSLALASAASGSSNEVPAPPDIGIRLTNDGPVFVDAKGMTLYYVNTQLPCDDRHHDVLQQSTLEGKFSGITILAPDPKLRRSCLQKNPPLLAPEGAQPAGKWTIHQRDDGSKQWAYDGKPVHRSIKDKAPGDVNGVRWFSFSSSSGYRRAPAFAPLAGAPPGVIAKKTALGLALAARSGKTLYYADRGDTAVDPNLWKPLAAPALATIDPPSDWSITKHADGSRQWAYKSKPLYTYLHDRDGGARMLFGDVFGGPYGRPAAVAGWRVALLKAAPAHPGQVATRAMTRVSNQALDTLSYMPVSRIYTDAAGMVLYVFHCVEDTLDRADCDDVGDSPSYWLNFCGGEERCARTWRPFTASAGAKPVGEWSVITINSRHPWQAVDGGSEELRVWAHRGRPVFTYAHDRPGHYLAGATAGSLSGVTRPLPHAILAYEPDPEHAAPSGTVALRK